MDKHEHCSCGHLHEHNRQPRLALRWLLSLTFICSSLIIMRPFIAKQLLSRASSYMPCELFSDAIRSYEKAVLLDKRNVMAWDMLGYSYKSNGDLEKSIYAYRQALKADPKDKSANFSIGVILASEKKYKEAVPYFEQIRAFGSDNRRQGVDIVSYHKSSLRLLVTCYDALKELNKRNSALEELHRYYPEDNSILGKI
ncbi:MAG: tetratricopeptide repeat protein [Candidatus Omnitrophota bacterium]